VFILFYLILIEIFFHVVKVEIVFILFYLMVIEAVAFSMELLIDSDL
jgi:hypothetical protein